MSEEESDDDIFGSKASRAAWQSRVSAGAVTQPDNGSGSGSGSGSSGVGDTLAPAPRLPEFLRQMIRDTERKNEIYRRVAAGEKTPLELDREKSERSQREWDARQREWTAILAESPVLDDMFGNQHRERQARVDEVKRQKLCGEHEQEKEQRNHKEEKEEA